VVVEQVHIGGIVIDVEQIVPPPQGEGSEFSEALGEAADKGEDAILSPGLPNDSGAGGLSVSGVFLALLFIGGIVLAYFVGKKGKAMLSGFKKASCVLLAAGLVFGASQVTFANTQAATISLPSYGFGRQDAESASVVHFDPRSATSSVDLGLDGSGGSGGLGGSSVIGGSSDTNPQAYSASSGSIPQSTTRNTPSYGDIIGVLTVENTGRRINVIAGATMYAMDFGAGWFSFTGLNTGNTSLVGHNRGVRNGFFSFVRHLQEGDVLTLEAGGITRSYVVAMVYTVDESDFAPLMQFGDNRLTLITCVEYHPSLRRVAVALAVD